jgi:hypothetical protein
MWGFRNLTRQYGVLHQLDDCVVEPPITLPISHHFAHLEMFGKMLGSFCPTCKSDPTEATYRPDFGHLDFPLFHGRVHEFYTMDQAKMLHQMVLSVKCSLIQISFLASCVTVFFQMGVIRCSVATEDTANSVLSIRVTSKFGHTRSVQGTHPTLKRKMQRFLMSLPVVLSLECLCAKGTLERKNFHREQLRILTSALARTPFAWSPRHLQRALRSRRRVGWEITGVRGSYAACRGNVVGRLPGVVPHATGCFLATSVCYEASEIKL